MKAPAEPARFAARGEAVARLPLRLDAHPTRDACDARRGQFEDALAIAAGGRGLTFVSIAAPVIAPSALIREWPATPVVAWSSAELTVVGLGCARELRARGADRWSALAGTAISIHGVVSIGAQPPVLSAIDSLGVARPRFLGGAAFAPGTADAAPWVGFGDAWFVLPRWTYTSDGLMARLVLAVDEVDARDAARWRTELARCERGLAGAANGTGARAPATIAAASPELWRAQVEAITAAIGAGACSKIVAARTCTLSLTPASGSASDRATTHAHHVANVFDALETRHPECVRLVMQPAVGTTLVAATPERLVKREGDAIECDALAGTIRSNLVGPQLGRSNLVGPQLGRSSSERDAEQLLASAKDRREHDLVVSAIRDALSELGAEIAAPAEPTIKRLRHVLHLHTPFRATASGHHVLELVARLHPTPAVGGTPTAFAIDWIRDHEPVPRGWYASPVGWFDLDGNGEFAVAIRSGVITGDRVHLWAGAGIVAGSDPDRELAETELKLRAMLGALQGAPQGELR